LEIILIKNDLISLIDGMKPNSSVVNPTTKYTWKIFLKKKARLSFLNLGNAQIEALKPHKIAKEMWDTRRSMYDI
jgi:hypothetical protein